jgi:hypothetical protein
MKPRHLIFSLCCLSAIAESRTVTLVSKSGSAEQRLEVPAIHSAEIVSFGPFRYPEHVQIVKDGVILNPAERGLGAPAPRIVVAGPAPVVMPELGSVAQSRWVTVQLTPDTFDASKALIIGPTTNTVVVSYQGSSNLVDWTTITDQVFQGVPSAQFFRVTASPTVTP